jgi:hypothetical protein
MPGDEQSVGSGQSGRRAAVSLSLPTFDAAPSARFAAQALEQSGCTGAVIGKIAMWVRLPDPSDHPFTKDLDLAVPRAELPLLRAWLAGQGIETHELSIGGVNVARPGDRPEDRVNVDFIDRSSPDWGDLGALFEEAIYSARERGEQLELGGNRLHVVSLEYLVVMKIAPGDSKNDADVRRILEAALAGDVAVDVDHVRRLVFSHLGPGSIGRFEALLREVGHPAARRRERYKPSGSGNGGK